MKTIRFLVILVFISASFTQPVLWAEDWETYEVLERLLSLNEAGKPIIQDDFVIFTLNSSLRRVGIAFLHENFANVYWFKKLVIPNELLSLAIATEKDKKEWPDPVKDSGIQFYIYKVPQNLRELEYRIVINGLWTTDPNNSLIKRDPVSGLSLSVLRIPVRPSRPNPLDSLPEGVTFTFKGPPGETVTVAGSFNGWDPFMYELRETAAGVYTLTLSLAPGVYQYVFFCRGQRLTDSFNPRRSYARDGRAASVIEVP